MALEITGKEGNVSDRKFVIVVSEYNREITDKLKTGAVQTLHQHLVPDDKIVILWVPGAWELTLAADFAIKHYQPAAVICLGCVIRGETTHDQHINTTVSQSLGRLSLERGLPVAFGLLTCNTWDQAVQRAGGAVGNKGIESTLAVIEMLQLFDNCQT